MYQNNDPVVFPKYPVSRGESNMSLCDAMKLFEDIKEGMKDDYGINIDYYNQLVIKKFFVFDNKTEQIINIKKYCYDRRRYYIINKIFI